MNKKIVVISTLFLLMLFAVVPVMAEPTKGQKVLAELTAGPQVFSGVPEKDWTTKGGIWQVRGGESDYYPIKLQIGSDLYTDWYSTNIDSFAFNLKTMVWNVRSDTVWTFAVGGFAGNVEMKLWFVDGVPYYSIHCLMHGFGDFERQTLVLSYDGPYMVYDVWTGYCLKG